MSDEIAKDSSASMAVENAENVVKKTEEFNNLKRRLEETEAELENERKKSKQLLEAKVADGVKLRPKRFRITLTESAQSFAQKGFVIISDPVDIGGFQWTLEAEEKPDGYLGLFLHIYPPEHSNEPFEFDVSMSFRVLNAALEKDITRQWPNKFIDPDHGWGFSGMIGMEELLDPAKGFLHDDGSIQLECDFSVVQIAAARALDHLLPVEEKESGDKKGGN